MNRGIRTTEMYSLTVLKTRRLKSGEQGGLPLRAVRKCVSPSLCGLLAISGVPCLLLRCPMGVSGSKFPIFRRTLILVEEATPYSGVTSS